MDAWKEYTDKANNFTDWFTAVLISNFAYLVGLLDKETGIQLLEYKVYLWNQGFNTACVALGSIFVAKVLGVVAASMRVDGCKHEKNTEKTRTVFFFIFGFFGIISLFFTVCIIKKLYAAILY